MATLRLKLKIGPISVFSNLSLTNRENKTLQKFLFHKYLLNANFYLPQPSVVRVRVGDPQLTCVPRGCDDNPRVVSALLGPGPSNTPAFKVLQIQN